MNLRTCLLGVVLLACGTLYANSCPSQFERKLARESETHTLPVPGGAIAPKELSDLEGLEIQMVSEQVDLTLVREAGQPFLDVDVTFMMENHSATDVTMGVCYPIGPQRNVVRFAAETDGLVHDATLRTRRVGRGHGNGEGTPAAFWFYDWEATFPAGQCCIHKVKYRHSLKGASSTGYTVSTGGPWKGKIEKSVITLSGSAEAWSYVRLFGPYGGSESGNRIVWCYNDYDPKPKHDIWINYKEQPLADQIEALRQQSHRWECRLKLCRLLRYAHYSHGRLSNDATQWRALREALWGLIREAKADGDRIVMPGTDGVWVAALGPDVPPQRIRLAVGRPYADYHGAYHILTWLHEVRFVVDALPYDPETHAFREAWLAVAIAGSVRRLYADEQAMSSTEAERAEWAQIALELNARVAR